MDLDTQLLRDSPCETRELLKEWLKYFIDIDLTDCIVDKEYSNCTPFDLVWKIYESAVLKKGDLTNALFIGCRNGGKTLAASVAEFMLLQHDSRSVTHIGAIEKQADRAYQYFQDFYKKEFFKDFVTKMVMKKTVVRDRGAFEIIPCTLASVNGPHTPLVTRDEIDTVQDKQAYKDISGIASPMPDKRPPIQIGISTRKSAFGLVQQEVDNAAETGMEVYQWGLLEMTEKCPDIRSGTAKKPYYVKIEELEAITEETWNSLPDKKKSGYEKYIGYEYCLTRCKMFAGCRGFLKNQTSTSKYLWTIDYSQKKLFEVDSKWAVAQLLCIKPPPEGLVYTNFREDLSIKSYREMAEIFLGIDIPYELTLEQLIGIFQAKGLTGDIGVDFGFTNPYCAELMYIDRQDRVFAVAEFSITGMDDSECSMWLWNNWGERFKIELVWPDIENPGGIKSLRKAGFVCAGAKKDNEAVGKGKYVNKDIKGGINTVRRFVKVPGTSETKFFLHPSCKLARSEFGLYHYKIDRFGNVISDEPEDESNHAMGAFRYVLHSKFGDKTPEMLLEHSEEEKTIFDPRIRLNAPTAEQIGQLLGMNILDNSDEYEKSKQKPADKYQVEGTDLVVEVEQEEDSLEADKDDGFGFVF